jgi:hypothetical protein
VTIVPERHLYLALIITNGAHLTAAGAEQRIERLDTMMP